MPFVYYLHLLLGQASFSTMEHSGVAHHCLNTQPCHQWYHISMPNRVKRSFPHQHPSLGQICSAHLSSRPQSLVCSTALTCDRAGHLCSAVPSLTHQVPPFLNTLQGCLTLTRTRREKQGISTSPGEESKV